jgi:phosphoglucosamine mutase
VVLNVKVKNRFDPAANPAVQEAVRAIEAELRQDGRVVLRASGTEPVIRVMLEGRDEKVIRVHAERLAQIVSNAAAA